MTNNPFFNAHHSPIGAYATLTFGSKGACGGLGIGLKGPADESLYIGLESVEHPGTYQALPFYSGAEHELLAVEDFAVGGVSEMHRERAIEPFSDDAISRTLGVAVDTWTAGDLCLAVYSPPRCVPDPSSSDPLLLKEALAPSVVVELTVDNRHGKFSRKAFFGYAGSDRSNAMRSWKSGDLVGISQGTSTAIATLSDDVYAGLAWQPEAILEPTSPTNLNFLLGSIGLLVGIVAPGERKVFRFAVAFFTEGTVTAKPQTQFLYRRWFGNIEEVLRFTLANANDTVQQAKEFDGRLDRQLSEDRAFMLAQAIRSYYGSTQCLELAGGEPFWVVNEGEYRMMNTFDLTVDQAFFELAMNPWTVRNELDMYSSRYSYVDRVRFPGESETHEGGIAFTHDMGIGNVLAERGFSGYEQAGLTGCFSYMSCEELVNWILTACLYVSETGDQAWIDRNRPMFSATLKSLVNRDHPDSSKRNGIMSLDSDRCAGGSEITTYDSLDASLGQARNSLYLGVKCWAAYLLIEPILRELGEFELAQLASDQAARCASTIVSAVTSEGFLPAVLDEGVEAKIIPAIEGLVYLWVTGREEILALNGAYGDFRRVIEAHFIRALNPGICLFEDGGWKLSSTSGNSWLSKIYLCQSVQERVFERPADRDADRAHAAWLLESDNAYYAWSDQIQDGKAIGSRYYPRGVTSILWLAEQGKPAIQSIRDRLLLQASTLEKAN